MESPVRIFLGAAVVVHLVLMSSSYESSAIPPSESKSATVTTQRTPLVRINNTEWVLSKTASTDHVADNGISRQEELKRLHEEGIKEFVESTKKSRGRVKYTNHRSTTPLPTKRTNTIKSEVTIVMPEPETKNISQILNSMRKYKNIVSTSTSSREKDLFEGSVKSFNIGDEDGQFDINSDFNNENDSNSQYAEQNDHMHRELRKSPLDSLSSQTKNSYKDSSTKQSKVPSKYFTSSINKYLDDLILTTPKNDFFDKKYSAVTKSIANNVDRHISKTKFNHDDTILGHGLSSAFTKSMIDNVDRHIPQDSKTKTKYHQTINGHSLSKSTNLEDYMNNKSPNSSRLYFHKSKTILVSDNEAEGSALSDIQGTSIYYENSMLSTESYGNVPNIASESDCDENDSKVFIPISPEQKNLVPNSSTFTPTTIQPIESKTLESTLTTSTTSYPRSYPKHNKFIVNTSVLKNNTFPLRIITSSTTSHTTPTTIMLRTKEKYNKRYNNSITNTDSKVGITMSTSKITTIPLKPTIPPLTDNAKIETFLQKSDGTINSIQKPVRRIQLSLPGDIDNLTTIAAEKKEDHSDDGTLHGVIKSLTKSSSPQKRSTTAKTPSDLFTLNSDVTEFQTETASDVFKVSRRIQYTTSTPKTRYRMSVRRNATNSNRPSYPTTIYAEHFNIKNKQDQQEKNKTLLTTVSSAIDPVYESEISGDKKIVHSHVISDNSIPTLRKRGSTRYGSVATLVPASSEDTLSIPTASSSWGALAGMRNPPSLSSSAANATIVKNLDENELQRVADTDKQTMAFYPATGIRNNINIDESTKPATLDQEWKPLFISLQQNSSQIPIQSHFSEIVDIITARPLDSPPTTQSLLTNELTGDTKVDTVKSDNNKKASGWILVNNTDIEKVDKNHKAQNDSLMALPSNPVENKTISVLSGTRALEQNSRIPLNNTTPKFEASSVPESTESLLFSTADFVEISRKPSTVRTAPVRTTVRIAPMRTTLQTASVRPSSTSQGLLDSGTSEPLATVSYESLPRISAKPMASTTFVTTIPHSEPTLETEETTISTTNWHNAIIPNNSKSVEYVTPKLVENLPVTTYRPIYTGNTPITTESETDSTILEYDSTTISTMTRGDSATTNSVDKFSMTNTIAETEQTEIVENATLEPISRTSTESTTLQSEVYTKTSENEAAVVTTVEPVTTQGAKLNITTTETILTPNLPHEKSNEVSSTEQNNQHDETTHTEEPQLTEVTTSVEESQATDVLPATEETKSTEIVTQGKIEPTSVTVTEDMTTEESTTAARTESKLEDLTGNFADDLTTHSPNSGHVAEENSSAAGVAIAVSTIGVIALLLLIGLLLVLRRRRLRGRRCGVYAQRCTPVSLDAYSLDSVSVRRKGTRLRASKRSYGNPAYDDEVVISHPMQYAALASFALNSESVAAEFSEIPSVSVRADEVPPGCEDKNRFSNVLPLPETRVPLQRIDGDPTSEYINANFVTGPGNIKNYYIACQAPMANTVNEFWRMMWEQNSRVIVMLTEYMENGAERCYEYLPPSEVTDNKRKFGDLQIILKRREQYDKYAVSSLQLKNLSTNTWREVAHLWYFWPAKGVPDDYDSIINFMSEMRSHMKISQNAKEFDEDDAAIVENGSSSNLTKLQSDSPGSARAVRVYSPQKAEELMRKGVANGNNGTLGRMKAAAEMEGVRPCVVMCASGAGRTGALLALDICARALEGSGTVDVPRTVRSLRAARPHALQNKTQYIFLYKVLSEYGHKLHAGVDSI